MLLTPTQLPGNRWYKARATFALRPAIVPAARSDYRRYELDRFLLRLASSAAESSSRHPHALVVTRDGLRQRLGELGAPRFALLGAVHAALAAYLAEEQMLARVAATTDIATLAHLLVGSAHLVSTDRENGPPDRAAMHRLATAVLHDAG